MRIIHITPTYFDESSVIGGGERYVSELAKAQARLPGCEVVVFSFARQSADFERDGVHYRIFQAHYGKHFTLGNPLVFRHMASLRKASVVHVHQLCTFAGDLAALAGRCWRIPVFGTDHGGGGARVLNRRLPVYACYRKVIGQSTMAAVLLEDNFPGRVETIPGGIDLERFKPATDAGHRPREVLFVGRLLPHKGIDTLIKAFGQWNKPGWTLRIVGRPHDDIYFNDLKTLAAGASVEFDSDLNDAELIEAYQRAALTVIPSKAKNNATPPPELMGFTVLESQACGTPVICSDAGPMHEFINEGKTGWVFPAGDAAALANRMESAAQALEKENTNLAKKCRSQAQQFSWDEVADRHLSLYICADR